MKKILLALLSMSLIIAPIKPIQAKNIHSTIYTKTVSEPTVKGIYTLHTNGDVMSVVENRVVLDMERETASQQWVMEKNSDGSYAIISLSTGLALGVSNKKDMSKAKVTFTGYEDKENQHWFLNKESKGNYSIQSAKNKEYSLKLDSKDEPVLAKGVEQSFTLEKVRAVSKEADIESSIDDIMVDETSNEKGAFNISILNAASNAYVSSAIFEVTPVNNPKKTKKVYASMDDQGNINGHIYARDFDYESGEYEVKCSLLLDGVYVSEIDTYSCQVQDAMANLKSKIENYITESIPAYEDWQVYLRDVAHDKEFGINSDSQQAASMIKMFVAGTCLDDYDRICKKYGKDYIDMNINNVIVVSSNPAWMNLVCALGEGDYDKGYKLVEDWSHKNGYLDVDTKNIDSHNFCSTKDTTQLFKDVYEGKYTWSKKLLNLFHNQNFRHKIPAGVPEGIKTGNKTGDLFTTENDTAIIYAPKGTYILSVMSTGLADIHQARNNIRYISNMVYTFLNE